MCNGAELTVRLHADSYLMFLSIQPYGTGIVKALHQRHHLVVHFPTLHSCTLTSQGTTTKRILGAWESGNVNVIRIHVYTYAG